MADPAQELQKQLAVLRETYSTALPGKLEHIEAGWTALRDGGWDAEDLATLHRLVHSLTGSGATFGYHALSQASREVEMKLKALLETAGRPSPAAIDAVTDGLAAMRATLQTPDAIAAVCGADIDADSRPRGGPQLARIIYLVEDDQDVADELILQLGHFGYQVKHFINPTQMLASLTAQRPSGIVMDVMFPEGDLAGTETIGKLKGYYNPPPPVVFISARDDLGVLLEAVRVGGDAYFAKPIDVSELIDKLDELTQRHEPDPYRVLIVDDDMDLSRVYALTLRHAGMEVEVVNQPLQVMRPLIEFKPDLILMDVYMPECSGLELAAAIRQQPDFVSIPLVFLSTEADIERQMQAMHVGADDFLTKPIEGDHLVAAVISRAERARVLRSYMIRDSLTGLLNHTTTREYLSTEVTRAKRHGGTLSLAMIDIDHFKKINDTYGHPCGDRVIKSLARLLRERLRKTDIVGRVGGEEFAVVLTDTDGVTALNVLDKIREAFSQIIHLSGHASFNTTFSCGIATLSERDNAASLSNAADRALYAAKEAGRNRVESAAQ